MEKQGFLAVASAALPGMGGETRLNSAQVARSLARLLVSTRALCQQSLYCHWLEAEPEFGELHTLFEHQYQSLRKAADVIAGRMETLGYGLPSQFSDSVWGTNAQDVKPRQEMMLSLIRKHQICSRDAKNLLDAAEATGDDVSAHLAAQRLASHDKAAWLLLSLVQAEPATRSLS